MKNRTLAIFAIFALAVSGVVIGVHSAPAASGDKVSCRNQQHCYRIWLRNDRQGGWSCNKHGCHYNRNAVVGR